MINIFRKKSVTVFSIVAGFIVLVATGLVLFKTSHLFQEESAWRDHSKDVINTIYELKFFLVNAETAERGYAIAQKEEFLDPYKDSEEKIKIYLEILREKTKDNPYQQALLPELQNLISKEMNFLSSVIEQVRSGKVEVARKRVQSGEGKQIMDQIRLQMAKIEELETRLLDERSLNARETARFLDTTMYVGLFLILALMFIACSNMYYDIRKKRVIQRQLRDLKQKAIEASQMKSDFLANMSHEIRTPMNGIYGMIELMQKTSLTAEQKDFMQTLQQSSEALLALINDILDLSKIEAGKLELDITPFEIKQLILSASKSMEYSAKHKHLELKISYDDSIPELVLGDSLRLRQIILNLVGNAIKFSHKGLININVKLKETKDSLAIVHFEVIDQGVGFDETIKAKLFSAFSQADSTTTRKFGGTGLGLSICRLLVQMMNGKIDVSSVPGKGSKFWFEIPFDASICRIEQANILQDKPFDLKNQPYVLVAEDNIVNQKVIANLLSKMNCKYKIVSNGQDVIDLLAKEVFDLILMDCHMPIIDGYEATKIIRKGKNQPNIPIIAATASVIKGEKEKCLAAGMNDYLSKPMPFDKLLGKIGEWTSKQNIKTEPVEINPTALQKIKALSDDDGDLLQEIVQILIKTFPTDLSDMKNLLNHSNYQDLSDRAHRLKSTCSHLGIISMVEICSFIEEKALAKNELVMRQKLDDLEKSYIEAIIELKKLKVVS
ncbi:MAG: CHASE3 domain-containing protein [Bdellovibrionota bacterium]